MGSDGSKGSIDPSSKTVKLAYAANTSKGTVANPTDSKSAFTIHSTLGTWDHNFQSARVKDFDAMISKAMGGGGAKQAASAAVSVPPGMQEGISAAMLASGVEAGSAPPARRMMERYF